MNKSFAQNRKAYFNYFVDERYEAGISLLGAEVKAIRAGRINIEHGLAHITPGLEALLSGVHIEIDGRLSSYNAERERKLLLHKKEIKRLLGVMATKKYRMLPLAFYLKRNMIKVEMGLCRIKKKYDKRRAIKDRDDNRRIAKHLMRENRE